MPAPRLLDKKVVNVELASQKRHQIDQGIAIAKKVDAVRGMLQEEQKNLETFRLETITNVQIEIDNRIKVRDSLNEEVKTLEERKAIALASLDSERESIEKERQILSENEKRNETRHLALVDAENDLSLRDISIKDEENRVKSIKERAESKLEEADLTLRNTHLSKIEIENRAKEKLVNVGLKEKEVSERQKVVEAREAHIAQREAIISKEEKDIINQKIFLADQRETLERAMNRLKK